MVPMHFLIVTDLTAKPNVWSTFKSLTLWYQSYTMSVGSRSVRSVTHIVQDLQSKDTKSWRPSAGSPAGSSIWSNVDTARHQGLLQPALPDLRLSSIWAKRGSLCQIHGVWGTSVSRVLWMRWLRHVPAQCSFRLGHDYPNCSYHAAIALNLWS